MSNQSIWRKPLSEIISDLMGRRQVGAPAGPSAPARRGRSFGLQGLFTGLSRSKEITALTIEHGMVKLVVAHGTEVLDYRVTMVDPQWFREGLTSDVVRMSQAIQTSLIEMDGSHQRIIGAVPGYQVTLGRMDLPNARDLDPAVVIPREVSQRTGVSAENSHIAWHRLGDNVDRANWLVFSATRRSMNSLMRTAEASGLPMAALELRPFALARAINRSEGIVVWTSADGCDVVIVRDSVPVAPQSAYWGAEPVDESVLVNRLTDIVGRTVALHDAEGSDTQLVSSAPIYITGSPVSMEPGVAGQVAANLQRPAGIPDPPLDLHPGCTSSKQVGQKGSL